MNTTQPPAAPGPTDSGVPTAPIPLLVAPDRPWVPGDRVRRVSRVVLAVLLSVGGLITLASLVLAVVRLPLFMSAALPILAVYGAVLLGVIRVLDRRRLLQPKAVVVALAWGGLVSTVAAQSVEGFGTAVFRGELGARLTRLWSNAAVAPVFEEPAKMLGVVALVLVLRRGVISPLHGMVLGSLCGLGFQLVEDALYVATPRFHDHWVVLGERLLTGLGGHWVYSALTGLAVGLVVAGGRGARRWWFAVMAVLAAMVLHGAFDATGLQLAVARFLAIGPGPGVVVGFALCEIVTMVVGALAYRRALRRHPSTD